MGSKESRKVLMSADRRPLRERSNQPRLMGAAGLDCSISTGLLLRTKVVEPFDIGFSSLAKVVKSDSVDSADGSKGVEPVELSDGWPSSPDGHCEKFGRDAQHVVCGVGQWGVSGAGFSNYTLLRQVGSGAGAEVVGGGGSAEESAIEGLDVFD